MKQSTSAYLAFMSLGFISYIGYFCYIGQANYWNCFYSEFYLTIFQMVFEILETLGSFLIIPLDKKLKPRAFVIFFVVVHIVSFAAIVPMKYIQNNTLKQVLTCAVMSTSGLAANMFYAASVACSSKISKECTQAIMIGCGTVGAIDLIVEDIVNYVFQGEECNQQMLFYNAIAYYVIGGLLIVVGALPWIWLEMRIPASVMGSVEQSKIHQTKKQAIERDSALLETQVYEAAHTNHQDQQEQKIDRSKQNEWKIFKTICPMSIAFMVNWLGYCVLWPLFILHIPSSYCIEQFNQVYNEWWELIIITTNAIFGMFSYLLSFCKWLVKKLTVRVLMVICYIRVLCSAVFVVMCLPKAKINEDGSLQLPLFVLDYVSLPLVATNSMFMSVTATIAMMNYQVLYDNDNDKARGSFYLNAFITFGMLVGSVGSVCLIGLFE